MSRSHGHALKHVVESDPPASGTAAPAVMDAPVLRMEGIDKAFAGVHALAAVSLQVWAGECVGLLGENGAGKSTLMKILAGVYAPDAGAMLLGGSAASFLTPRAAQDAGVAIIHQEFNLLPNLSVAENIFIGREPSRRGVVRWGRLREQTKQLLDQYGLPLSPDALVRDLSVAEQQLVEIGRALSYNARLIVMDEPTSALPNREADALLAIVRDLCASGLGVVFISHRLDEVFNVCDRIVVLRDGRLIGERAVNETSPEQVVQMMVGRPPSELYQKTASFGASSPVASAAMEVRGLSRTGNVRDPSAIVLQDVSLSLFPGEIVGLAGLVGSGRTELARALFGVDRYDRGELWVAGRMVDIHSPLQAIRHGLGFVPEDRKAQGLILQLAIRENVSLANLRHLTRWGFVRRTSERENTSRYVDALGIRSSGIDQPVVNLSGGNQQKVVIAKWLSLQPSVLIMDEPTRGIDIAAKAEVHKLMTQLTDDGIAILMISSELPEILGMSDRVLVMRRGRIAGELSRSEADEERVMRLATGVVTDNSVGR